MSKGPGVRVLDFWHSRWQEGRFGWHEADGNEALRKYWPGLSAGSRVLVPLCGKSVDLLWLAQQGLDVTGVELSEVAARAFFEEAGLGYVVEEVDGFNWFQCREAGITIACGNYFEFSDKPFDALYDRAALSAVSPKKRPEYVKHTKELLKKNFSMLLITLEFDEANTKGPPYPMMPGEVKSYWSNLQCVDKRDDTDNSPSKFQEAGVNEFFELTWISKPAD